MSGGKIKIVRQGLYTQGAGCLEGAGSQKWLGIMPLFTDEIVLIDCVGRGCVFGGGAGRDGCQPLDLGKSHLRSLPPREAVCAWWLAQGRAPKPACLCCSKTDEASREARWGKQVQAEGMSVSG